MTEIKRDEAFKAKLLELVTVVKELHNLAKLSFPNGNPYISSRFGTYGDIYAEIKEVCKYFGIDF